MRSKLIAFLMLVSLCHGQAVSVIYTSRVSYPLGPLSHPPISIQTGTQLRHQNYAETSDGSALPLAGCFVTYEVVSGPTLSIPYTNVTYSASLVDTGRVQIIQNITLPAGTYHTRFKRYQTSNTNFLGDMSWDTLIVTNGVSTSSGGGGSTTVIISNQHIAGLQSQGISSGKVAVTDGAGGVAMQDYGGSTGDGGITNLVVTNAPAGVVGKIDAQNWTIGTNVPASSGSTYDGLVMITNTYGIVGHTNAYGVFIPVAGSMYPPGTPYIARTFEAPYTLTNLNQGNWSAVITNGMLVVTADSNSVTQVRIFGNEPIPTGVNVGVCVRLKAAPVLRDASDYYYFGLAGGLATNSYYYGINITANNSEGTVVGQNGPPGASIATSTGNESATMLANITRALSLLNIDGRRIWLVFDWNPTTRLLRQGVARDNDGIPFYPYQLQGTTNFSSDITQAGIWLTQRTISRVPMQWAFDDFLIYTNLMFP